MSQEQFSKYRPCSCHAIGYPLRWTRWSAVSIVHNGSLVNDKSGASERTALRRIYPSAPVWAGGPPIIFSMAGPPVRRNRTTSTAARMRKTRLRMVV
jgi:hypothetical protein